jgi:hypothetical protein
MCQGENIHLSICCQHGHQLLSARSSTLIWGVGTCGASYCSSVSVLLDITPTAGHGAEVNQVVATVVKPASELPM